MSGLLLWAAIGFVLLGFGVLATMAQGMSDASGDQVPWSVPVAIVGLLIAVVACGFMLAHALS